MFFKESKSQGLLLIYFQVPCRPRKQRLRKFKSKDFENSDERKIGNEIINYSVNREEQICSSKKMKENCTNWGLSHSSTTVTKAGGIENPSLFQVVHNSGRWKRIKFVILSLTEISVNSQNCIYSRRYYKVIRRFINSADLQKMIRALIILGIMLTTIKVYKILNINEIRLKSKWHKTLKRPECRVTPKKKRNSQALLFGIY